MYTLTWNEYSIQLTFISDIMTDKLMLGKKDNASLMEVFCSPTMVCTKFKKWFKWNWPNDLMIYHIHINLFRWGSVLDNVRRTGTRKNYIKNCYYSEINRCLSNDTIWKLGYYK